MQDLNVSNLTNARFTEILISFYFQTKENRKTGMQIGAPYKNVNDE